jgi:aspartyl-tRNA(Asn)/glutamyl-tRNA(Gln) amidotransferase subunit A
MTVAVDTRSVTEIAPAIASGALSPVDLVETCLARIQTRRSLNAFITVRDREALAEAREAEADIKAGRYRGPLHGIPISIKDLVDVTGTSTTSGSALPARDPAVDATLVRRLKEAGAIVIGKTNLHEFAFGTTSDETAFGPVRHPRDATRSAGGSSGGAAVAVVEGMCFASVGTDTGGSIRIPSAACGIVGLKPAFGEIPCDGVVPLSGTLDHAGPMTRTVADAALLYDVMRGSKPAALSTHNDPIVFGVPRGYFFEKLDEGVRQAFDRAAAVLTRCGHLVTDIPIPHAAWTPDVYLHIVLPEAAWFHGPLLERYAEKYSPGVRLRLEMGRYVLAEDYVRAMRLRDVLTAEVESALTRCDVLMLPGLAIPAPPIGAASVDVGTFKEPVRAAMLRLTQLFNVTGHPAIVLPAGEGNEGLPRSIQLVGRGRATPRLLQIAAAVEAQIATGPGSVGGGTG